MTIQIETIKDVVAEVAKMNGARLAVLFGSYARGTATDRSDIDLIFVEETDLPYLRRIDRYFDPLVDRLKAPLEMLVYTPAEFEKMKDRPFVRRALAEGLVVYES
ncbi:MAG: nucleotidyltransferase domain-containing protein [Armatimonadetes bacterium]|nr:nucleotidyltransferase domain-containing protein [Armatimonadota bacterium]